MANSNAGMSSGNAGGGQYQVFLNFHGRDTRYGFTSFLHRDLVNNGIHAFIDNKGLRCGQEIGEALRRAIDDSQIYIPIFSQNYAKSKWCLRELARMVHNEDKSKEKKILPIFYYVKPDDVDLKTKLYRRAIGELKKKHEKNQRKKLPHEVEPWEGESWVKALKKVDKIKGLVLQQGESQAKLVDSVVEAVLQELKIREKFVTEELVGLDDRVKEVLEILDVNCSDKARLLGIHGMGGIGKTTLARAVYNKLHSCFGKYCAFLNDIREMSKNEGLVSLQKKLLTAIDCSDAAKSIDDVDYGRKRMGEILGHKKILIVLDDVGEEEQIENLIGQRGLHPETRVIITTRNTNVLEFTEQRMAPETKEVNFDPAIRILLYEMEEMNFDDALQLLKRHAALKGSLAKDIDSLLRDIVFTVRGLPLALKVTGSSLRGEPIAKWKSTLKRLRTIPHRDVLETLKISFDALNDYQRNIFLDIACFFINEDITNAKYMWEACEFYPELEIDVLVKKSLIKIKDEKFWMHDQLRDLGREIVRKENSTNLGKRSRLWTSEEVLDLVKTGEKKKKVEALELEGRSSRISISHEEVGRFNNLRFLRLSKGTLHGDFIVSLPNLRWISWRSLNVSAPSIHSKKLVVLELIGNTNDLEVWELIKMATKLKNLTLVGCFGINKTPDLSRCLDLERLTFDDCLLLKEIDISIGKVTCLLELNITDCGSIKRVPDEIGELVKLERLSLRGCFEVSKLPTSIGNLTSLKKLDLSSTGITSLPESIGKLRCLSDLILEDSKITEIPSAIEGLVKLRHFHLGSMEIKQLPDLIGKLESLCTLNLSVTAWSSSNSNRWKLPITIGKLKKLEELYLGCRIELIGEIPDEIGNLSSLRVLDLCSTKICRVPGTIKMLSRLSKLDLTDCNMITELPEFPTSLVHLHVQSSSLRVVPNLSELTNLVDLALYDWSGKQDSSNLELALYDWSEKQDSSNLEHKCDLGWIGRLSKLKKLTLYFLKFTAPAPELGLLSFLEDLTLEGLDLQPLKQLPPSLLYLSLHNFSSTGSLLSNLKVLSTLMLDCSRLQEIPLDGLSQLELLCLNECDLQSVSIPSSLQRLRVYCCPNMLEIQFLGMSASLEFLTITDCPSIGRMVLCVEVGSLGIHNQSGSSSSESTDCSPRVLLLTNAFKKLKRLELSACKNLLEIQVVSTWLSLQEINIDKCNAMEKLSGISNLKNLHNLSIGWCAKLQVVEGLDELKLLTTLFVCGCPSLEPSLHILNSKIPKCRIRVTRSAASWTLH